MSVPPAAFAIAALVGAGELAAREVALELIQKVGGDELHAWEVFDAAQILAQADALDSLAPAERARLRLAGVPVAIKDAYDTRDLPTAYGSPIYAGHRPRRDADLVAQLRGAGAVIAGKTKCTEFSWMTAADTANPIAPGHTPGGSSSGSAAAVAAGQVPLATATQTAGSTVRPGSYCGVLGFKPTFGTLPREGVFLMSPTLDTAGLIARMVPDLVLALEVLTGADAAAAPLEPPRIGFVRTPWWEQVEPEAQAAIESALERVRVAGHQIVELPDPPGLEELARAQHTIQWRESAAALERQRQSAEHLLSPAIRAALDEGAAIPDRHYEDAKRAVAGTDLARHAFEDADAILTPSSHGAPPPGLAATGDPLFSRPWMAAALPSISVPIAWTADGLPAGLQLVGPRGRDRALLEAAAAILA